MPQITVQSVRQYYEQNTRLFTCFGSTNNARSIHRALWLPGIVSLEQALSASNELVLQETQNLTPVDSSSPMRLVDLGCGIGGTLFYLLKHLQQPSFALGVTISSAQAEMAQVQAAKENNAHCFGITVADFEAVPLPGGTFDLAFSIEAFAHAVQPVRYLAEIARLLRPGGRLVLIDDFLSAAVPPKTETHRRWLNSYREGWRLPALHQADWVAAEATRHGLVQIRERDLTPWLKLRTLPNWAANLLLRMGSKPPVRHAIWGSMLGSLALQHCLKAGLVEYRLLVFERRE